MTQKKRPSNGRKKRRKKKKTLKKLLMILCVLAVLTFVISVVYTVFQVKTIQVTGNEYTKSEEVTAWIKDGKFSDNTLYVFVKYNMDSIKQLPSVESVDVKLKSPWVVEVKVHEKELIGRIDYGNEYLYFDIDGTACHITAEVWEGIPYVEGIEVNLEEVKLGEKVPVEEDELFEQISDASKELLNLELNPDRMVYDKEGITIHFGEIRVMLGTEGFEDKLEQVPPILTKLSEQYPGATGVLHLEDYEVGEKTIRFVPDEDTNENVDEDTDENTDENVDESVDEDTDEAENTVQ